MPHHDCTHIAGNGQGVEVKAFGFEKESHQSLNAYNHRESVRYLWNSTQDGARVNSLNPCQVTK